MLVAPKSPPASSSREIYEDGVGDFRGKYEDGAYYASSHVVGDSSSDLNDGGTLFDPQLVYFDSILSRYKALRRQLQQVPPAELIAKLDKNHPTYVPRLQRDVAKSWKYRMRTVEPWPVQVACMDKQSILRLLILMTQGSLLKRGVDVEIFVSQWLWALLAKLPDRGELNSEEIGIIRELGKKAVLIGIGLKDNRAWEEGIQDMEEGFQVGLEEDEMAVGVKNEEEIVLDLDDGPDELDDIYFGEHDKRVQSQSEPKLCLDGANTPTGDTPSINIIEATCQIDEGLVKHEVSSENFQRNALPLGIKQSDNESLAEIKARMLDNLNSGPIEGLVNLEPEVIIDEQPIEGTKPPMWNTRATVDIILTLAGEMYGQRDLLEFRTVWDEGTETL